MILTNYGLSCFRLLSAANDTSVLIDPFDQSAGLKMPRLGVDLVLYSQNPTNESSYKDKDGEPAFVISGPGEYEVKTIFVYGVDSVKKNKKESLGDHTTIFVLAIDDMFVGHLGGLDRTLTEKELDQLGRIDVLLLPVGGGLVLDAKTAMDVIGQIEPRIVVPMTYKLPGLKGDLQPVDDFLKEYGNDNVEHVDKLKIMKKDLPAGDQKVIVLNPV